MENGIKINQIAYHRNGISGEGFYAVNFTDVNSSKAYENASPEFIGIVFPDDDGKFDKFNGKCAVLNIGLLPNIAFGENSWRGDHYEKTLRTAIKNDRGDR